MISMPQVQSIRRLRRNGESVASIARKTHVSEPTVRKYLAKEDLSAVPSVRKPRASVIDPYLPVIEQWLAEDRANWRKQRHTATRIWERLRDEHGAEVSLSTVTRAVARLRREFAAERDEAFMDLVWHPGEAQADFGEVDVLLRGVVQRMHHFVLDFPYSNVGLVQLMPGENAECTCLALRNLFEWLGGVPERIVFDNAAGVGHKGYGEREPRLTHLFQAFQAHYGFDCSFCNPYSGHEKGAVESKVGMVRRKLFVPRPSVWSLENFNAGLPDRCLELATKPHYRKDTEERGLFSEDRAALLPLPGKRFDVVTWRHMKADRYGVVTLEGRHRYSADRANAGRGVIVGLRALEDVRDLAGDELLHMLVRAVVVGAVGDGGAQTVCAHPCAHQMVGRRLRGAVRACGTVRRVFRETRRIAQRQIAVYLASADAVEAHVVLPRGLQQPHRALHVRADKRFRVEDGIVVM